MRGRESHPGTSRRPPRRDGRRKGEGKGESDHSEGRASLCSSSGDPLRLTSRTKPSLMLPRRPGTADPDSRLVSGAETIRGEDGWLRATGVDELEAVWRSIRFGNKGSISLGPSCLTGARTQPKEPHLPE